MKNSIKKCPAGIPENSFLLLEKRTLSANTHFPLHWHDYIEIEFIISGTAFHNLNDISYDLTPGCCHILTETDFHSLTASTDLILYCIHFNRDILPYDLGLHLNNNNHHCKFTGADMYWMLQLYEHLLKECTNSDEFSQIQAKNIFLQLFVEIVRNSQSEFPTMSHPVLEAISYVNKNFQEPLTLTEIAALYNFSPNYFGQIFKNQTGKSFNDYLASVRLQYACRLLVNTSLPIKEIATSSGFSSVEYFFKTFKNQKGITPREYKNQLAQNTTTTADQAV